MAERTCKDCFHYKACKEGANCDGFWDIRYMEQECKEFLPTADVAEVKHGEWIGKPIAGYARIKCSVCHTSFVQETGTWAYCPECGAKNGRR